MHEIDADFHKPINDCLCTQRMCPLSCDYYHVTTVMLSLPADLPTLKSLKPEHLFMLCEWNSSEGLSEARPPTEGGPEIKKK